MFFWHLLFHADACETPSVLIYAAVGLPFSLLGIISLVNMPVYLSKLSMDNLGRFSFYADMSSTAGSIFLCVSWCTHVRLARRVHCCFITN